MSDSSPNDPELDALLGAYALDALDPQDQLRVDAYLAVNAHARREVDELRETAASLVLAPTGDDAVPAPPELWDRISAEIAASPQTPRRATDELEARRARRLSVRSRVMAAVATAAAIVALVLGAQDVSLRNQIDDAKHPGGREIALAGSDGVVLARAVVATDGSGYLVNDHLRALRTDQTYQLWALMGDAKHPTVVSAGVLGPNPKRAGFNAAGPLVGFALTVEQAGGVVTSKQTPIAQASLA